MRRLRRLRRAEVLLALLSAPLAACLAGGGGPAPGADGPPLAAPENEAAFQALGAALADGRDAEAAALAGRLRQRPLTRDELGLLDSAERVLRGRELVRGLDLRLVTVPDPDDLGTFALVLEAVTTASVPLVLRLPAAEVKRSRASINAHGDEGLEFESKASRALAELRLAPGVTTRVELRRYELALGRALAVRERWRLEPRAGEIELGGARFPAQRVRVIGCERERLSPLLAPGSVPAGALAEGLRAEPPTSARALLELALRTSTDEREQALAALVPVIEDLAARDPARVAAAEPALRWLTQNRDLGPDAKAWARYLAGRPAAEGAGREPGEGALDLPALPPAAEGAR
jgi:hypothetical protein